jgi:hypothetical protein
MKQIKKANAEELWCPHSRFPYEVATGVWVAVNRKTSNSNPNDARCITTECIYWEQETQVNKHGERIKVGKCVHS